MRNYFANFNTNYSFERADSYDSEREKLSILDVSGKGLGKPKKFAPCELGVRPARTGSSPGANWKSVPG